MNWSDVFNYDSDTGIVTWKISPARRVKIGDKVGRLRPDGYLQFHKMYKTYLLHRVIWDMCFPEDKLSADDFIDHIDHDRSNNRLNNLRKVSRKQNMQNQSRRRTNTTGHTGIYWCARENKWNAQITVGYKTTHLGYFVDKKDAITARRNAEVQYGFHDNHGKDILCD